MGHMLGVVAFILFRLVHLGVSWEFIQVHSRDPWGSLGSFGRALGVVGVIRARFVLSGVPTESLVSFKFTLVVVRFIRVRLDVPLGSMRSIAFVFWFIRARPASHCINLCSFGPIRCTL